MPSVYTRGGDKGTTALFGGTRVDKDCLRVEAYGALDEANTSIGCAKAIMPKCRWKDELNIIQQRIFVVGSELASDDKGRKKLESPVDQDDVDYLECLIDDCLELTGTPTYFVIPGADPVSAELHRSRTVIRRAERRIITLSRHEDIRPILVKYVNRLSDALYAIGRVFEHLAREEYIEKIIKEAVCTVLARHGIVDEAKKNCR